MRKLGMESIPPNAPRARPGDFDVKDVGWRYHMSDLMAGIGRAQLARFESELKPRRIATARRYRQQLGGLPHIELLETDDQVVPHIFPIRAMGLERNKLRDLLLEHGYETNVHYKPNHLLSLFRSQYLLPQAERLYRELLSLPLHHEVTDEDVDRIAGTVRCFCGA